MGTYLLFAHGADDGDEEIFALIEAGLNLLAKVTLRDLDIVFGGTVGSHEIEEAIINVDLYLPRRGRQHESKMRSWWEAEKRE